MDKDKKIILYDSDDAATWQTGISGWVSCTGRFFGDNQSAARYDGYTHKKCECGKLMTRGYTKCEECRNKSSKERYLKLKYEEWDGNTPLTLWGSDDYFFDVDSIEWYLEDNDLDPEDLELIICIPNKLDNIDSDYWEDIIPEGGDIPKELIKKIDELNKYINSLPPISYSPSNARTIYKR